VLTAWGVLAEGEAGRWRAVRAEELEQLGRTTLVCALLDCQHLDLALTCGAFSMPLGRLLAR